MTKTTINRNLENESFCFFKDGGINIWPREPCIKRPFQTISIDYMEYGRAKR
jgi:hypothetical protein